MKLISIIHPTLISLTLIFSLISATSMDLSSSMDMSSSINISAAASTLVDTSPPYTITALPAVQNASSCLFNCLIPIGVADPSGCDDVTENCACLSAPFDVMGVLTNCIATVCNSSTSAYQSSAISLYESYCESIYGTTTIEEAITANEQADASATASNSLTSVAATTTASQKASSTASSSASITAKSSATSTVPSFTAYHLITGSLAIGGLLFIDLL